MGGKSRGTACHPPWHAVPSAPKPLKLNKSSVCARKDREAARKLFNYSDLGAICSLLRQVCTDPGRRTQRAERWIPRQSLAKPALVGGCLLLCLLLTRPVGANANDWAVSSNQWTTGSSFQVAAVRGGPVSRPPAPGSSFAGIEIASSFQLRPKTSPLPFSLPQDGDQLSKLRALIAYAEAGPLGYDAYHQSARIAPVRRPTQMTLAEIQSWIAATPGQHHALGRYQIIPNTLADLMSRTGVPGTAVYSPQLQDAFANVLIVDAGYGAFQDGNITRDRFMANLAKVWAGLPLSNGKSAYDGIAGNRATISRATFDLHMAQIFP